MIQCFVNIQAGLEEREEDCLYRSPCRFWTELHSYSCTRTLFSVNEVDVQPVFHRSIAWMVIGDVDLFQLEPSLLTLAAPRHLI